VNKAWGFIFVFIMLLGACKPGTPSQYIQPDDIEDILVEYHLARAIAQREGGSYDEMNYREALYIESVLRKYGYTKEQFDSSLMYYYKRADRFDKIYKSVADRLEEQALVLGATEGEIGKYASLNATGDTANIWAERTTLALMTLPPYNHWDFHVEVDSSFKKNDSFMMQFMADYMFQDGSRDAILYLAVTYDNDTTISKSSRFASSGLMQLNIPEYKGHEIKKMRGFFYLGNGSERTTTTRLLFLNNIQLIRFHGEKYEETKKDSIESDTDGRRLSADTLGGGDSRRSGAAVLSVDSGAAVHRVARRPSAFNP